MFNPCSREGGLNLGDRRCYVVAASEGDDVDVEGRNGAGPDDAEFVVVGLHDGRHEPFHADPVATHDRRSPLAVGVKEGGVHRLGVAGTQLEDVSQFDSAMHFQVATALRASIARLSHANVGDRVCRPIAAVRDIVQMEALSIRSGNQSPRVYDAGVGDDSHRVDSDRRSVAGDPAGPLDLVGQQRSNLKGVEHVHQFEFVDFKVTADHGECRLAVDEKKKRLSLLLLRECRGTRRGPRSW